MHSKNKAFTLMEMLIAMTVISILMVASVPLITQMSKMKTGTDKNVADCINQNTSTGWYDTDAAGATILPPIGTSCYGAVTDIINNRDNAYNATYWMTVNGTADQKIMAKKILRAACDQGGTNACDYFINNCRLNGSASSPYCDDTTAYTDITYYLHLNRTNYVNKGATYIVNQLTDILPSMPTKLLNEVFYAKTVNPNLNNNLAYNLAQPSVYIQSCNNGNIAGCVKAYTLYYNRSCYQIKNNWPTAPSQIYKITYNSAGATDSKYCNMNSLATAAITGCQSMTAGQWAQTSYHDCYFGRLYNYNLTCNMILSSWPEAPNGTYNLTWNGSTQATVVPTSCPIVSANCIDQGPGTVCADGTVYAGDFNGFHYYTTPNDQGTYTWGTFLSNTQTNVFSPDNGSNNTLLLHNLSDPPDEFAPYNAANACYTANDLGYTDWYLPASREILVMVLNKVAIGNFGTGHYWASTEAGSTAGATGYFTSNYGSSDNKWNSNKVRCVRKQLVADVTCPLIGDTCADGSKYAGPFIPSLGPTYYLFTTPTDKGSYTWNDGLTIGTVTGATDENYGMNNYNTLISLADGFAPYNAALTCKTLNDTSAYGYTDWYLGARYEMGLLQTNKYAIGNFVDQYYWTSTETSRLYVRYRGFDTNNYDSTSTKNSGLRVRCIRRSL